jgi:hypothetical protein
MRFPGIRKLFYMLVTLFVFLGISSVSSAATIWCNPANSGTEDGLTKLTGYNTLHEALSAMSTNDTLIIANGDWRNMVNMYIDQNHKPPDGTGGNYSRVHAETDWQVKLPYIHIETTSSTTQGYLEFRGIVFDNKYIGTGTNHIQYHMHHTKFIRCGFLAHGLSGNSHATGFGSGDSSRSKNHHNLMEECIVWGSGRYMFYSKYGQYNIFRRCIARHDYNAQGADQIFNLRAYACDYHIYQNCISIDSDRIQYYSSPLYNESGGFWAGDSYGATGNEIHGCISIKDVHMSYYLAGAGSGDAVINNSVALDITVPGYTTLTAFVVKNDIDVAATNILGIGALGSGQDGYYKKKSGTLSMTDSIVKDVAEYGLNADSATNVNHYNAGNCLSPANWGRDPIGYDPEQNGLLYPVRIETGSTLETVGSGGGVCGPTILKKIGVSGTLYGEDGWDRVTDEALWPFPNEDKIKALMRTTVSGVSGEYGFCTGSSLDGSPQTLTKYIWEYLGNPIPSEIYSGNQPLIANAGQDQNVADADNDGTEQVTLDGSNSSDPDGTIVSYIWKENGAEIANGATPTVGLSVGSHDISLTVINNNGADANDAVVITISPYGNQPLIANAGQDQNVADADNDGTEQVTLDGSNSSDPDGTIVSYIWNENGVDIANGATPTVGLSVGSHNISLIVTDNEGAEDTDTVVITIYPYSVHSETKINFQPPDAPTPSEYMADEGFVFDQTRGYGWDGDISFQSRDRNINSDQRLDTFIFADDNVKTWEIELPNGQYLVSLSVGDADAARGNHKVILEGEEIINGSTLANQYITVEDHSLTVSDGKLTMQAGGGNPIDGVDPWGLTNLNYIIIKSVSSSALPPPDSLSAQSTYSIELSWSSVTGAVGYNVYRSTTQGIGYVKINIDPVTGTSYLDENTTPGATYYYVVTSLNSAGVESSYSPEASCTVPLAPVNQAPQITGFTAVPSSLNNPGETTTFNVSATDPDGDSLTYTISFGDGTANGSGSQVVHTYEAGAGEPPHIYTATVTVSDDHGHSVGQSLKVTVNDIPPAEPTNVSAN